jgi:nucleotide-binding universal stress UspA family protein
MRVVLAIDESNEARRATKWLRGLPLPEDTMMCVVSVATLLEPPNNSQSLSALRDALRGEAARAGEHAAAILGQRWPQITTVTAEGDARVEILHVAEDTRADMIVVGSRGLGRIQRFLGGSTSLAVARYARCSVAIVQGQVRPLQRVLVAIDDSPASRAAIAFLSLFDPAPNTSVTLLHVLGRGQPDDACMRNERSNADELLANAVKRLATSQCPTELMVLRGDAAGEIVRVARERNVDLVVLGARGLRALGRLFLGSVSEVVLHHAGRAVLIVRET